MTQRILLAVVAWMGTAGGVDLRYWIETCTPSSNSSCQAGDPQLAEWALQAWQKAAGGKLRLERTTARSQANIRLHWASAADGQYGEARPFVEGPLQGADVYVRPDLSAMGPEISNMARGDSLWRETIVYLTCLHETGHALGLSHTADFPDIMYSFQFGGDIPEYFGRYRRRLQARADVSRNSGISQHDQARLLEALR